MLIIKNKTPLYVALVLIIFLAIALIGYQKSQEQKKNAHKKIEEAFNTKTIDEAILIGEDAVKNDPKNLRSVLSLAASYAQKGSVSFKEEENGLKAVDLAEQAIKIDPKNSEAYRIKGYAYEIQEKYDEALKMYDKAIELDPQNSLAHSNKGHVFDLLGDFSKAEYWYKKSLDIDSKNEHGLLNMARMYFRKRDYVNSEIKIQELLKVTQNKRFKAEAYQLLGTVLFSKKQYDDAEEILEQAITYDARVPQVWVLLGEIYLWQINEYAEEAEEVEEYLADTDMVADRALAINPNQATAYFLKYKVATGRQKKDLAEEYKQKALKAAEMDITLGKADKEAMMTILNAKIGKPANYKAVENKN